MAGADDGAAAGDGDVAEGVADSAAVVERAAGTNGGAAHDAAEEAAEGGATAGDGAAAGRGAAVADGVAAEGGVAGEGEPARDGAAVANGDAAHYGVTADDGVGAGGGASVADSEATGEGDAAQDGVAADDVAADSDAAGGGVAAQDGEAAADGGGGFTVRLDNFEGPFDLLLQLISKHKLDVTEVALSKVTDEFMAHIRAMGPDWDLDQTTEFLVVAATLLDLKAARLLPAAEVEDEADLALLEARDLLFARLLQYRAYKRIADIFNDRLIEEARRYPRTVGLEPHHADLLPDVVIRVGPEGFAKLAVKAMQAKPKPQVYVDHIHAPLVSVREQAEVVVGRLRELGEASFATLTEDAPDTLTVVARFLALLELYRERAVLLDQSEALGALIVRWSGAEDGQRPLVTDEFDQEQQAPAEAPAGAPAEAQEVRT
ncbi:segregation and condensation protein A [Streptomyces sp. NPDC021212]|uniref:segregation and condensation protein A n=1 Tax=Streptomyces sp. NPDC021212 TaxID=3365118 RepID=UPI00378CE225